jgi:hypothetical protein
MDICLLVGMAGYGVVVLLPFSDVGDHFGFHESAHLVSERDVLRAIVGTGVLGIIPVLCSL